ncbi:uncharacterized protein LOC134068988 isoform X2 [Sardina pilchardus]|uniref:uncharacterized protein LOC134068988 isoform X2 n=1 Tax=Sardina pilchardus TaxID=27697 RepID=UPI002E1678DB
MELYHLYMRIHHQGLAGVESSANVNVNVSTSRESARRKREICTMLVESAASKDGAGATTTSEPEDDGDGDISTMDPEPVVVNRGSQCNIRCLHRSLGIQKALDAERDCEDLKLWRPAVINHLYWTAASTPTGDPDEMQAKWQSMINHIQYIHQHSTPEFPSCAHPPLEGEARDKAWLEPDFSWQPYILIVTETEM